MTSSPNPVAPRVLLVDDEPANIQVLIEALPGLDLTFATDGARALELCIAQPFDLILLDVVMPGIGGLEVLRWLKSEPRTQHVPVIFVTNMTESDDEERGLSLGAVDYITKPIRPPIVRARVHTQLELKRQRDLLAEYMPLDALTGIPNRRRFEQELARAWGRAKRVGRALTLALIEVDHFERYVDHYGHSPADECLVRVAQALDHAFNRGGDCAARYGASQFALLFEGSDGPTQARRVLRAIGALEIPHVRSPSSLFVSTSIGILTVVVSADQEAADCLVQATALLQTAVAGGGNRAEYLDLRSGEGCAVLLED